MSDLSIKIIGAGLAIEGITVENMEKELIRLRQIIANKEPVCPHCKEKLKPYSFEGYYDSFCYWGCDCEKLPLATTHKGAYN